ncbi:MAG: NUDIX domain-containing protein [Gammaproteobacteria bacterium]|nr:MAG: NUDIX domain-containing protein [Gammaproteobacteria bacterium]
MKWELLERQTLHQGFYRLESLRLRHQRFDGSLSPVLQRERLRHGPGVGVLPYDPVRDEVVLIEQFRVGALDIEGGPWLIEIVAGLQEAGESPEQVARREALEEAGCEIGRLTLMHRYLPTPAGSDECIHLYLGHTQTEGLGGIHGLAEEGEDIRVHVLPAEEAFRWMDEGRILSAMPLLALYWLRRHHHHLRQEATTP